MKKTKIESKPSWASKYKTEWALPADETLQILTDLLDTFILLLAKTKRKPKNDFSILIPGIGYSQIAFILLKNGFHNLVLTDIEEKVIEYQKHLCQRFLKPKIDAKVETKKKKKEEKLDILCDNILNTCLIDMYGLHTFDLILDSSFLDVFIRNNGPKKAKEILITLTSLLDQDIGMILSLSIYHPSWKYISDNKNPNWITGYGKINKFLNETSNHHSYQMRERKTGIERPIAVLLHLPHNFQFVFEKENCKKLFECFTNSLKLNYLDQIPRSEMPIYSAEYF